MLRRWTVLLLVGLWPLAGACGPQPDIRAHLKIEPLISGYYDDGVTPAGENRMLPSLTFQFKNEGDVPIASVPLVVAFWRVGDPGEQESKQIPGIGREPLAPGATSEPITVRSGIGYTSPYPRVEFFTHSQFVDFYVRAFAKQRGTSIPVGEFSIERRVLPSARQDGGRP
jgi:hypothetical protein